MKSVLVTLLFSCSALGSPQFPHNHRLLGDIHPTQLPPIRGDEAAPADQTGYEARTYYQTGYRLQNTGYRPVPDPVPQPVAVYSPQDYRSPPTDYKASTPKDVVPILTYTNDVALDGSYNYNFESADGIARQESAVMTNAGTEEEGQSVQGSYSYTAPDGTLITVNYVADKDGFRAEGAHLPTPPPIPEAIAKSLEYIARVRAAQPAGYEDDGQYQPEDSFRKPNEGPFRKPNLYST